MSLTEKITLTGVEMKQVIDLSQHAALQNHLSRLRDKRTKTPEFRTRLKLASTIVGSYATADLVMEEIPIDTPLVEDLRVPVVKDDGPIVASVLRAGNPMQDAVMDLIYDVSGAHVGLERDHKTLKAKEYYFKAPDDIRDREVLMVDPMLATANSSIAAAHRLIDEGVTGIRFLCLFAAPYGIRAFLDAIPDATITVGVIDKRLNKKGYIMPGLGDAGDRLYGTK